jgi:Beta-lactamase superfamily domain
MGTIVVVYPFCLWTAMLGAKRDRPLTIAGPRKTTERLKSVSTAMMPGMEVMTPKFPVTYIDMDVFRPYEIGPLNVLGAPAIHTKETNPTSLRVEVAGKCIAYTGDGEWSEHLPGLAEHADLLIAECHFFKKPVHFHLNYPDIVKHRAQIFAQRIVLTHFGREMLANLKNVPEQCAYDRGKARLASALIQLSRLLDNGLSIRYLWKHG